MGLQSRLMRLTNEIGNEAASELNLASAALYFGGKPVVGSVGIEAEFAATAIADFQDLVVRVFATSSESMVGLRGPVPNQNSARLHVTALLHGSMGFLIEEIDTVGSPMSPTPLKYATDEATNLIASLPTMSEEEFQQQLEKIHPRVFASAQSFFKHMHRNEASVRLVNHAADRTLSNEAVNAAFIRLEESSLEEAPIEEAGLLLGILPNAGRFEFKSESGVIREGKVAPTLSEAYLKRIEEEHGIGKWFLAKMTKKEVRRHGRTSTTLTLTELSEIVGS